MSAQQFDKVLIANRGEIACRIIASARKMGLGTVAVYSDADREALHVASADEAIYIGGSAPRESYLSIERILAAARSTSANAIHPGYGFLSENASFCQACTEAHIVFIGPPASAIEAMGSKSTAKKIMAAAKVPLLPGYHDTDQTVATLRQAAKTIGYPVLLKASAGGGGKGMRIVKAASEFNAALEATKREAMSYFGDDSILIEKYLSQPRHIEIQLFLDQRGNAVYLFERDCSIQRRHQKVIEEAPAPGLTQALRQSLGTIAIKAAQAIDYVGAGTVEFLLDRDGTFYFMEMNTRLQVEHPVTEMITGQDLVEWQLRIAAGEALPMKQAQLSCNGHAIEARICAEEPSNDFLPTTGPISFLQLPELGPHVRVDTGVRQGDEISIFYDSMIAKLIVWDEDRDKALRRLLKALRQYCIGEVTTNIQFLHDLVNSTPFREARLDTQFIETHHSEINLDSSQGAETLPLAALYLLLNRHQTAAKRALLSRDPSSPWQLPNCWRLNEPQFHYFTLQEQEQHPIVAQQLTPTFYIIEINGRKVEAQGSLDNNELQADIDGHRFRARVAEYPDHYCLYRGNSRFDFKLLVAEYADTDREEQASGLVAPMNGILISHQVELDATVAKGDALLIMEAMKMEQIIRAPSEGRVTQFYYQPEERVEAGAALLKFEASSQ